MSEQNRQQISLMPTTVAQQDLSPWHSMEAVSVRIKTHPLAGEVYKVGTKKIDGQYVDMYGLSKKALDKLQQAGGIKDTTEECWTKRVAPRIWLGHWSGVYVTPNGTPVPLTDEYEFDAEIGGTRWSEKRQAEIDKQLKSKDHLNNWRATQDQMETYWVNMPEDGRQVIIAIAELRADKYVTQAAQYGAQRAMTGARDRAIRRYFQVGTYPKKTLDVCEFQIIRTRYDFERMAESLGENGAQAMQLALLAKNAGLDMEKLARVQTLLTPGIPMAATVPDSGDEIEMEAGMDTIEGSVLDMDEGSDDVFGDLASDDVLGACQRALAGMRGGTCSKSKLYAEIEEIFGEGDDGEYSQGQIELFYLFLQRIAKAIKSDDKTINLAATKSAWQVNVAEFAEREVIPTVDDEGWAAIIYKETE